MLGVNSKIKKIRIERNFSQESVVGVRGITQSHYSKMERGKIDITMGKLLQIAKVFDVDVKDLV